MGKHALFIVSWFIVNSAFAQFQHSYGLSTTEKGKSLTTLFNDPERGKYLVAGFTTQQFFGSTDATLTKTDPLGNQIWTSIYGRQELDFFNAVRQSNFTNMSDVSYVMAGGSESFGLGGRDAWLVGTDFNGFPIFSSVFGRDGFEVFHDVKNYRTVNATGATEFGYVAVGTSNSYPFFPNRNVYVVKTDVFGNLIAATVIGGEGVQVGFWIEQTNDGGFILVGHSSNFDCQADPTLRPPKDIFVVRLRSDLTMIWNRKIGFKGDVGVDILRSVARAVKEAPNGNFYITGHSNAFGLDNTFDTFLLILNPAGGLVAFNTYGTPCENEFANSLELGIASNGVVRTVTILGGNNSTTAPDQNAMMFQLNPGLAVNWAREYGLARQDYGLELTVDNNNHFAFTGFTASLGAGLEDKYLVETDLSGKSGTFCEREIDLIQVRHDPCITKSAQQAFVDEYERIQTPFERITFKEDICFTSAGGSTSSTLEKEVDVLVTPNPSVESLAVTLTDQTKVMSVNIYDAKGQTYKLPSGASNGEAFTIDISSLNKGIYIIEIHSEEGKTIKKKFIKE